MAKQAGIIPMVGTIGGINFYMRKGKPVLRAAGGGFNSNAIKKGKNMERVRENGSEFGHCSRVKKVFKNALFPFFGMQKDAELHGRMMRLFTQIKDFDVTSERGKRTIAVGLHHPEAQKLLTQFEFTPFNPDFSLGVYDVDSVTYSTTNFHPQELKYPNGATHLEIQLGVMVFDFDTLTAVLFTSNPLLMTQHQPLNSFSLTPTNPPVGNGLRFPVLAYRYQQEVNGMVYPLKDKNAYGLRVVGVGV